MVKLLGIVIVALILSLFSFANSSETSGSANIIISGDSVIIPSFTVEVELTPKAQAEIASKQYKVVVMGYFSGYPVKNIPKQYQSRVEFGEMALTSYPLYLKGSGVVEFNQVSFSKKLLPLLKNRDLQLLINIYSQGKPSDLNILNGEIFQGSIASIEGKTIPLKVKLISEE